METEVFDAFGAANSVPVSWIAATFAVVQILITFGKSAPGRHWFRKFGPYRVLVAWVLGALSAVLAKVVAGVPWSAAVVIVLAGGVGQVAHSTGNVVRRRRANGNDGSDDAGGGTP